MKRRLSAAILFTQWLLGLSFICLFQSYEKTEKGSLDGASVYASVASIEKPTQAPEIQTFELDLKIFPTLFSTTWTGGFDIFSHTTYERALFSTSPLFDVKTTFLHFFYTW